MSEPLSQIPGGLRYYFGREARLRRSIEDIAMSVLDGWSYEEISTPTVDYYSLFDRAMGHSESNHAFRFTDVDGRLLALRPEVTSSVARAAATLFAASERPLRLCYTASVFRQQPRTHAEWRRELTQIGCELTGMHTTAADMELLIIASEILERLGLGEDYLITLNNIDIFNGVAASLGLDAASRDEMRRSVDARDGDELERFLAPHASATDRRAFAELTQLSGKRETLDKARGVIRNARSIAGLEHLESLWRIIESLDLADHCEIDLGDVSRLDYYTGLTFKIYVEGAGVRMGSGGRYDGLSANFGKAEPAIGFVLDLEALTDVLLARRADPALSPVSKGAARRITNSDPALLFREATRQRAEGQRVLVDFGEVTKCPN